LRPALVVFFAATLLGQERPKNTYHSTGAPAAPRVVSPEIHPDRTIAFRPRAPAGHEVVLQFQGAKPMAKHSDGLWSILIGTVEPEIYEVQFRGRWR
jgi:hypothetical protein